MSNCGRFATHHPRITQKAVPKHKAAIRSDESKLLSCLFARERQWAEELAEHPTDGLAITGVRLFDADSAVTREGMTVTVFESMFRDRPGQLSSSYAVIADRLPPQVRRTLRGGGLPVPEGMEGRYRESFQRMLDAIKHPYDQGITIVAGADALTGFTLHRELELYAEAGIPAREVLIFPHGTGH